MFYGLCINLIQSKIAHCFNIVLFMDISYLSDDGISHHCSHKQTYYRYLSVPWDLYLHLYTDIMFAQERNYKVYEFKGHFKDGAMYM